MKYLRCYTTKWCRSDYANAVGNTSDNLVSGVIIATSLFLYKGEKSDEPATKPVKITSQERVSIRPVHKNLFWEFPKYPGRFMLHFDI